MYLKEGDILYIKPDRATLKDEFLFGDVKITSQELMDRPFPITMTRTDGSNHDICIIWLDGTKWWWGQIGYFEPWTKMFITEKEYLRNKKIEQICQIG